MANANAARAAVIEPQTEHETDTTNSYTSDENEDEQDDRQGSKEQNHEVSWGETTSDSGESNCMNYENEGDAPVVPFAKLENIRTKPTEIEIERARKESSRKLTALENWYVRLQELINYYNKHGNFDVPQTPRTQLGNWVNKVRANKRMIDKGEPSSLTPEKLQVLNEIGFTWAVPKGDEAWERQFTALEEFRQINGHCDVPTKHFSLGRWVSEQRRLFKEYLRERRQQPAKTTKTTKIRAGKLPGSKNRLAERRFKRLVAVGFRFNILKVPRKAALAEEAYKLQQSTDEVKEREVRRLVA